MRKATAISAGLHAAVLLWATLSFSGRNMNATPAEALPIDLISDSQFTQLTKGAKDAEKKPDLKPLVEKIAPEKTADEIKPKVTEKQEVQASVPKQAAPPPPPEPKQAEKKSEQKPAEKKEAKAAEKPVPVAQEKTDAIADQLKKEEAKKEKAQKEAKLEPKPMPPKKPPVPPKKQPEFDPAKIAALLDQRDPKRYASAGEVLNSQASLGRAHGSAAKLSANEIEAFRRRVSDCWQPPLGADGSQNIEVVFRVMFNPDGTVKRGPDVVEAPASASLGPIFAESARRALLQCQPYTMLHKETYDQWKDLELAFNLRDMFR
jgi:colicin import membrane protein